MNKSRPKGGKFKMKKIRRPRPLIFIILLTSIFLTLSAQKENPRDYTAHLVGHAHIDLSWLWTWEETVHDIATNTFNGVLKQMKRMPGLTYAQSQAALYEAVEKNYPELFSEIKTAVEEGRWIPVGGMWVEPDLNMPDGESLIRQFLYGKNYFRDKFGVDVTVGWNPDSFGHNWQLPQILAKSGLKYYVFERCAPEKTQAFWWEGVDGSRVLSYVPPGWYNVSLKDGVKEILFEAGKNSPLKDFMILYGEGDHGGGPRASDVDAFEKFRNDQSQPRMQFTTPENYFRKLEASGSQLPVVKQELNFTFPACYTTQVETKKNNRLSENLLLSAEKFSALAVSSGCRDYYPERDLDEAWKIVLRNQFHDILDGSSIGPVYDEVRNFYREALERGKRALDFSLEAISNEVKTQGEGLPVIVYNQLFWERTDPAEITLSYPKEPSALRVVDSEGEEIPFQVIEKQERRGKFYFRILFIAEDVPSFGYRVYWMKREKPSPAATSLHVTGTVVENDFFKVSLNPRTGWVKSIFDKKANREALASEGNILQAIVDEPESMSAWELGLKEKSWKIGEEGAQLEVVESGPLRGILRVKNIFRNSYFEQDIILYHKIPLINFRLRIDWQERNLMIKSSFTAGIKNKTADFEIPFGHISRVADGTEVPALKWVDISDESGNYGVSLLNDCKYGFDVKGNTMRISVIHGPTYPDPEADRGSHELLYSLHPHQGTWKEAETVRKAYELNNPLLARVVIAHPGKLPSRHSFIRVEPENVIISSLKKESGYYNRGVILRMYEISGKKTEAKLTLPWPASVIETDLIERPFKKLETKGQTISTVLEPFEIKTLKLIVNP